MAAVELRGIVKRFGAAPALRGIDVAMEDGALTVVVGPSGCGKSTLLSVAAGLEEADAGEVWIGGARVDALPPARRDVAMVFQSYALYPHMTVFENMAFPLRMARRGRAAIEARVREVAALLGLTALLERRPAALSGGQQQRVAMGRALVRDPAVTLFDEPLSNLDAQLRLQMREEIAALQARLGATMVYVTHDQVEAMTLAHRIVVLRDGAVEQVGPPLDLYHRPVNLFVARFFGAPPMNLLEVAATEGGVRLADGTVVPLPGPPGALTLGIRPEHLVPVDTGLPGTVGRVEALGAQTYVHLDTAAGPLVVALPGDAAAVPGERLSVALPAACCHLFDAAGAALHPSALRRVSKPPQ